MVSKGSKSSPLRPSTNAKRNTKAGRDAMPSSDFALPAQQKYRIDDPAHARDALGRAAQNATPAEQKQIKAAVAKKYPSIDQAGTKPAAKKPAAKSSGKRK
jgi:hypothetical protein